MMNPMPSPASAASELAESWVNGNRKHVLESLGALAAPGPCGAPSLYGALATCAHLVRRLEDPSDLETFLGMLESRAEEPLGAVDPTATLERLAGSFLIDLMDWKKDHGIQLKDRDGHLWPGGSLAWHCAQELQAVRKDQGARDA